MTSYFITVKIDSLGLGRWGQAMSLNQMNITSHFCICCELRTVLFLMLHLKWLCKYMLSSALPFSLQSLKQLLSSLYRKVCQTSGLECLDTISLTEQNLTNKIVITWLSTSCSSYSSYWFNCLLRNWFRKEDKEL